MHGLVHQQWWRQCGPCHRGRETVIRSTFCRITWLSSSSTFMLVDDTLRENRIKFIFQSAFYNNIVFPLEIPLIKHNRICQLQTANVESSQKKPSLPLNCSWKWWETFREKANIKLSWAWAFARARAPTWLDFVSRIVMVTFYDVLKFIRAEENNLSRVTELNYWHNNVNNLDIVIRRWTKALWPGVDSGIQHEKRFTTTTVIALTT